MCRYFFWVKFALGTRYKMVDTYSYPDIELRNRAGAQRERQDAAAAAVTRTNVGKAYGYHQRYLVPQPPAAGRTESGGGSDGTACAGCCCVVLVLLALSWSVQLAAHGGGLVAWAFARPEAVKQQLFGARWQRAGETLHFHETYQHFKIAVTASTTSKWAQYYLYILASPKDTGLLQRAGSRENATCVFVFDEQHDEQQQQPQLAELQLVRVDFSDGKSWRRFG